MLNPNSTQAGQARWAKLPIALLLTVGAVACNSAEPSENYFLGFSSAECAARDVSEIDLMYGSAETVAQLPDTEADSDGGIMSPAEGVFPSRQDGKAWMTLEVRIPRNARIQEIRSYMRNLPRVRHDLTTSFAFTPCEFGETSSILDASVGDVSVQTRGSEQIVSVTFCNWSKQFRRAARVEVDWTSSQPARGSTDAHVESQEEPTGPESAEFSNWSERRASGREVAAFPAAF